MVSPLFVVEPAGASILGSNGEYFDSWKARPAASQKTLKMGYEAPLGVLKYHREPTYLPVPVLSLIRTSRPSRTAGINFDCKGVGVSTCGKALWTPFST